MIANKKKVADKGVMLESSPTVFQTMGQSSDALKIQLVETKSIKLRSYKHNSGPLTESVSVKSKVVGHTTNKIPVIKTSLKSQARSKNLLKNILQEEGLKLNEEDSTKGKVLKKRSHRKILTQDI